MSMEPSGPVSTAQNLRQVFDRSFAEPHGANAEASADLLAIRANGDPYAFHLAAVTGLFADRTVTPLPGSPAGLLGLAGFRGVLVPVYDLRALLGSPGSGLPRWLVLVAARAPVALAFDGFDGHLRLPRSALIAVPTAAGLVRELAHSPDGTRAVLHLPAILDEITTRAAHRGPPPGASR